MDESRCVLTIIQNDYVDGCVEIGNITLEDALTISKLMLEYGLNISISLIK